MAASPFFWHHLMQPSNPIYWPHPSHYCFYWYVALLKDVSSKLAHYVARVKRMEDENIQLQGELESQSARLSSEIEGLQSAVGKKER